MTSKINDPQWIVSPVFGRDNYHVNTATDITETFQTIPGTDYTFVGNGNDFFKFGIDVNGKIIYGESIQSKFLDG